MFVKSVLNVLLSVSVRTNVPAMKVTPRTMARAVRTRRSLCARRPLIVTRHTSALRAGAGAAAAAAAAAGAGAGARTAAGAEGPHVLQDRVGRGRGELVDDVAVGEEHDP